MPKGKRRNKRKKEKIRSMKIEGLYEDRERLFREGIFLGGVTLLSKGEKEKELKHEDKGSNSKERYPFPLMSKGKRKT